MKIVNFFDSLDDLYKYVRETNEVLKAFLDIMEPLERAGIRRLTQVAVLLEESGDHEVAVAIKQAAKYLRTMNK